LRLLFLVFLSLSFILFVLSFVFLCFSVSSSLLYLYLLLIHICYLILSDIIIIFIFFLSTISRHRSVCRPLLFSLFHFDFRVSFLCFLLFNSAMALKLFVFVPCCFSLLLVFFFLLLFSLEYLYFPFLFPFCYYLAAFPLLIFPILIYQGI